MSVSITSGAYIKTKDKSELEKTEEYVKNKINQSKTDIKLVRDILTHEIYHMYETKVYQE